MLVFWKVVPLRSLLNFERLVIDWVILSGAQAEGNCNK